MSKRGKKAAVGVPTEDDRDNFIAEWFGHRRVELSCADDPFGQSEELEELRECDA